jgi:histone H3/H4
MSINDYLLGRAIEQDRTYAAEAAKRQVEYDLQNQARETQRVQQELNRQLEMAALFEQDMIQKQSRIRSEFVAEVDEIRREAGNRLRASAQLASVLHHNNKILVKEANKLLASNKQAADALGKAAETVERYGLEKAAIIRTNFVNVEKLNLLTQIKYILMTYNKNATAAFTKYITELVEKHPEHTNLYLGILNHPDVSRAYIEIARDIAIQKNKNNVLYVEKGRISEENYLFYVLLQEHQNPRFPFKNYLDIHDTDDEQFQVNAFKQFYQDYLKKTLTDNDVKDKLMAARGEYKTVWTKRAENYVKHADTKTIQELEITKIADLNDNFDVSNREAEEFKDLGYTIGKVKV